MPTKNTFHLGRLPSSLDLRDYQLASFIKARKLDVSGSKLWEYNSEPLNQASTNHCVGFSMANFGINMPTESIFTDSDGHEFYRKCKVLDGDPTGENGTSIRSAAKALKLIGLIENYAFASSVDEISWWLLNKGPVIVGTAWTDGMFSPDENNIIHPTGSVVGGHAYLLNEKLNNLYGIQNSWNNEWGVKGKAYISISDFASLFRFDGEAIAAVELENRSGVPSKGNGCLNAILNLFNISQT